ncbi:nucleotidyltransferase domain-containing protein [Paenisporosarcina sp. TG20]|uniref:nucleotidyltransferase domain-containing protein n=1 Tax=Paenisporosarcina sp. TG20 TaxID=1211706 RepID=UPI00030E0DC0|nr:nucleotidyltransferase domain-containing protein [Paenisporosarcina sp. TG20]
MQNRSKELIQIATNFIGESNFNVVYACVGGSVGRGDADTYSDIDLTVYSNDNFPSSKMDILTSGEIIQLEIVHISDIPNEQAILHSPWEYRFIIEQEIIKDTNGSYRELQEAATAYFNSTNGKNKIIDQVSKIVRERIKFAIESIETKNYHSANFAAMGAWSEAGFLYLFMNHNTLSTGSLFPQIEKLIQHIHDFKSVAPFSLTEDLTNVPQILRNFRKYLREQGQAYSDLSKVHDTLCDRKIQRLLTNKDTLNLLWQMYGEAVGLYFETSNGVPIEQYLHDLPFSLQKGLSKIGFVPLSNHQITELCRLSEELLSLSYKPNFA